MEMLSLSKSMLLNIRFCFLPISPLNFLWRKTMEIYKTGDVCIVFHKSPFWPLSATFNKISGILWQSVLLVEETGVPGENHWPSVSHWQIYHNVVSSTFIVLAHWNNSPRVDMLLHSDTLFWFRANQSMLLHLNVVFLQQIPILIVGLFWYERAYNRHISAR